MIDVHETRAHGQRIEVEDLAGLRWQVDCLGEPVEPGTRIRFEPLAGGGSGGHGVLVRVLESERERWVCTVRRRGARLELVPFGGAELPPLALEPRASGSLREGDRVVVARVTEGTSRRAKGKRAALRQRRPAALPVRVVGVLGRAGDPDADHHALVWKYRLPAAFTRRARLEVEQLPESLPASELARRLDLRHLPFITIDPASARDHDDALYAEGQRLWVAIADVSHFVPSGGFVDAEARRRGNSFYFPDRAIPMLPERLSSELCSLRPDEDRLVLAVELRVSEAGEVLDAAFHEAVIRSQAKLSYEQAAAWLAAATPAEGAPEAASSGEIARPRGPAGAGDGAREAGAAATGSWQASLGRLSRMAEQLALRRRQSGAIELELPEVEIDVDDAGRPLDARLRQRNPAHALVEEAMLAANRAVASALERARRDSLHRVHPAPDADRLEALSALLDRLGVPDVGDLEEPGALAAMLRAVRGAPAQERVHLATLRAMSQARYEARSRGHFALQFPHYLHFTSPIRRYADLAVHRGLKDWLRGEASAGREASEVERGLERLAIWLSGRERVAIEAEREAAAFACCALLAGREGEPFEAEVTGVSVHGLFVRLVRPAASGLVPLLSLDERWRLDEDAESLEDARGGGRIEVGTRLRVRLIAVDGDRGRLAFALAGTAGVPSGSRRSGPPRARRGARGGPASAGAQGSSRASDRPSHSR